MLTAAAFYQIGAMITFLCVWESFMVFRSPRGHLKAVGEELEKHVASKQTLSCFNTVSVWETFAVDL